MAFELLVNDATNTLNGAINNSTTTVVVNSASSFPTTGNFRIKIDNEIMLVTNVSGNTFTVTRNVESTSAASHDNGATVRQVLTKQGLVNYLNENTWRPYPVFTPSGVDDEFDDANFSGWTAVGSTPVPTTSELNNKLSIFHPGSDGPAQLYAWMKSATINAGDYIEMCFRTVGLADNYPICGLVFANGTTYNSGTQVFYYFSNQENQLWLSRFTGYNANPAFSSIGVTYTQPATHVFLRLKYNGSNSWTGSFSCDGVQWIESHIAASHTLTPTHLGFAVTKWGGSGDAMWSLEYFRKGS